MSIGAISYLTHKNMTVRLIIDDNAYNIENTM